MATKQLETVDDGGDKALSRTKVFDLLSSRRRRYAMHALKQHDGPMDVSDIAEQVAAWENEKTLEELSSEERHRVYTSMQQTHLPALKKAGVIEYDKRTVREADSTAQLDVYIDVVPEQSLPWAQYYLGLSLITAGLVVAVAAGVFPESIPTVAWLALVVAVFGCSALYHTWINRRMYLGRDGPPPEVQ